MPKYLYRVQYSREGLEGTVKQGFAKREAQLREMIAPAGATIESLYWAYGDDDLFLIVDAPDTAVAVGTSLAASIGGVGRVSTTPLLTAAEMDAAVAAMPAAYRPPGA